MKKQARDDAQRQQVKLLFFVNFVISEKQKHPILKARICKVHTYS